MSPDAAEAKGQWEPKGPVEGECVGALSSSLGLSMATTLQTVPAWDQHQLTEQPSLLSAFCLTYLLSGKVGRHSVGPGRLTFPPRLLPLGLCSVLGKPYGCMDTDTQMP